MSTPKHEPGATSPPLHDEADIGSGEKTPAQHETEQMIRQIPPLPPASKDQKQPTQATQATAKGEPAKP